MPHAGPLLSRELTASRRAMHVQSGLYVALKKVQIFENITSSNERHEVVREAKHLREPPLALPRPSACSHASAEKLDHPNIIKCYDSWIEHGEFYVSLELCEHGDLQKLIQTHQRASTRVHPGHVSPLALCFRV